MNEEQRKRLAELKGKGADLSAEEKTELKTLEGIAKAASLEWDEEKKELVKAAGDSEVSLDDIKTVVEQACKSAVADADEAKIREIVKAVIAEKADNDASAIDQKALEDIMADAIKKSAESVAKSAPLDFTKAFQNVIENQPKSKMQHDITIPQGERAGNLSVAEKQLVNTIMERPQNDGIDARQIAVSKAAGEREYKGLIEKAALEARLVDKASAILMSGSDALLSKAQGMLEHADTIAKDLTTAGAGTGLEFIPRDLSSELLIRLFLESRLAQRMAAAEVNMPTNPFDYPLSTTRPVWKNVAEGGAPTQSDPGTGETTLTAKKLVGYVGMTYEMEEDSIIAVLPFLRQQLGLSGAESYEDALINGDDSATHQDSDTHAATGHVAKVWKGFRKLALAASLGTSFATGGIDKANLRALRKSMGKYGMRPSMLTFLASPNGINDIMTISEVYTRDTFGRPVLEAGDITRYENIEIIPSEFVRDDLNASGVYDGVTSTKGSLLLVNLSRFITGRRREFTVEFDKDIKNQTSWLIASYRKAFTPVEAPSASVPSVVMGYNYDA